MGSKDLGTFWGDSKLRIGEALPNGIEALADILQTGADDFGLVQQVQGEHVLWSTEQGKLQLMFCRVADPRDVDCLMDVYVQVRERQPTLTAIFVHQWTDGEGNWDAFVITPQRALQHADRICGSGTVHDRGPKVREEIYTLFACDREFPEPGCAGWARLLAGPIEPVYDQLHTLACRHDCTQTVEGGMARWFSVDEKLQAMFFILPEPADIQAFISMYEQLRDSCCPVSFVFVACERPGLYDVFRLSARSYLEHHNQAKAWVGERTAVDGLSGKPTKQLEGLRWVRRWASHVGCIKGCLSYLGIDVSDAWLFGATGHAFVLNISPGLCPSGPTDWDTSRFLSLGSNVGYLVEAVDEYCPKQDRDLLEAQERAWTHVKSAIDNGYPCYGWELDIPEYFVIYGYDQTGYYISGPECDGGKGPVPWQNLGRSEIGSVLVSSVRPTSPADATKTVRDALTYALDLGHDRQKWTDRTGGLQGYDAWTRAVETGIADRFGPGYNAAVWAESRRFAVAFLKEAQERLDDRLGPLFTSALGYYKIVATNLNTVSDTYPFKACDNERVPVDEAARAATEALMRARDAETAGLDVLTELIDHLTCRWNDV
ncbi:MAG: hypothetical protein ISS70_17340 [Phycisphaerae bacterium]|nr:hypothetical protein [Phycisphaerae bacterium]